MGRKKQKITDHLDKLGNATSKLKDSGILDAMAEIGDVGELFQVVKEIGSEFSKDKKGFKLSDLSKMLFEEDGAGEIKGLSGAGTDSSNPWNSQSGKSHRWVNTEADDYDADDEESDGDYDWEADYSCYEEVPVQLAGGNQRSNQPERSNPLQGRDRHSGIDGKRKNGQGRSAGPEEEKRCAFEVYHRDHPLSGTKAGKRNQARSQNSGITSNNSGNYPNLEEIIVWSEIIGDPVSVKRRKQRNERRYGYQGYAGRR